MHIDYVKLNQEWNYSNVISPYHRLYYIDEGMGSISDNSELIILEQGYLYLIPSFTVCNLNCDEHLSQYFIQFFEESSDGVSLFANHRSVIKLEALETDIILIKRLLKSNPGRGINRSSNPKAYEKEAYYQEYQSLNNGLKAYLKFENQGILLLLLSRFLKSVTFPSENSQTTSPKIIDTISYIQLNLNKNLNVGELAARINHSQDYFSKLFLYHTGKRPLNYIHEKKIERAQYLIATTNKSFLEIALDTGFSNLPHFSKIFKRILNLTPGQYRFQNKQLK
ncbi:Helix-turn-helix domain-containing protein [Flavobacterium phragmitis]|uniref:Helix-turn-helix domain-containing protein n=2 Tax=Flavobacterium phragmitis TaxID=739143 RepID=A0A1I1XP33_9FLAO|nr:Helix-turn-helix domain-containing protein [Flavobacterium phragmitis]